MIAAAPPLTLDAARPDRAAPVVPVAAPFGPATVMAVLAGVLTAFTVSLVGEFPLGEFVLFLTAGWAGVCAILNQRLPGALFHQRYLWILLLAQAVALAGYAMADLSWRSAPGDVARGWGRMIFLAIDLVALAYLFGRSGRNLLWFLGAQLAGDLLAAWLYGARFEDTWKFGYGVPVTYAVIGLASFAGPAGAGLAALGMGLLNFAMDFRSVGALCLLLASVTGLQFFPAPARRWLLPFGAAAGLALAAAFYQQIQGGGEYHRATRSDVDRAAMVEAAAAAFWDSPFIGHGSWFSRSQVYDDFVEIRDQRAKEAGVGGFAGPNEQPENVALHSQLLVALAEGGLLGGTFFFAYGAGLVWAVRELAVRRWRRDTAVRLLLVLLAGWNLLMSPFSGAHRVYIAAAAGLLLLLQSERAAPAGPEGAA